MILIVPVYPLSVIPPKVTLALTVALALLVPSNIATSELPGTTPASQLSELFQLPSPAVFVQVIFAE